MGLTEVWKQTKVMSWPLVLTVVIRCSHVAHVSLTLSIIWIWILVRWYINLRFLLAWCEESHVGFPQRSPAFPKVPKAPGLGPLLLVLNPRVLSDFLCLPFAFNWLSSGESFPYNWFPPPLGPFKWSVAGCCHYYGAQPTIHVIPPGEYE